MSASGKYLINSAETLKGEESLEKENTGFQKDSKYAWFVCACAFTTQVFVLGVLHAFGVFFVELIKEFNSAKGETAWIGSLAYGLSMTFGPITSMLVGRFGSSKVMATGGVICATSLLLSSFATSTALLFVSFSLLYGVGTCMATSPTMTITPLYFDKYLSVATGITVAGSSFGTLIMGPLSQGIIDIGGWRLAFRVFAGFCILTSLLNSRIRTLPHMKRRPGEGHSFIKDLQIWKNRVFVVWTLSITLVMFGFYIPYVHLVSFAIDQGVSPDHASYLMMVMGATTASGRIMFGKIVQYGVLHRLQMHQLSMLVTGTGVMILPLLKTYPLIVLYVIIVGLVDGCYVVLLPILTASLMGIENSVLAWGFMIGMSSVTFTLGPPAAGALYDLTGSYNVAFHCAGLPILLGSAVLFLIPWAQRTARGRNVLQNVITESTLISSQPETSGEVIPMEEFVVKTTSAVTVKTRGTSPVTEASSYVDKATSTDDIPLRFPYSMDVEDALSQLSYNSCLFDEMLKRSAEAHRASMAASTTSQEIPKIPPPTEPILFRRREGQRYSYLASPISQGSEYAVPHQDPSRNETPSYVSTGSNLPWEFVSPSSVRPVTEDEERLLSASLLFSQLSSRLSPAVGSVAGVSGTVPFPVPLQQITVSSVHPRQDSGATTNSVPEASKTQGDSSEQETKTQAQDSPPEVDDGRGEFLVSSRQSSVSPAIDILRPQPSFTQERSLEADVISSLHSSSFLAKQIAEIETATKGSDVMGFSGGSHSTDSDPFSGIHFDEENQLTVVPARKTPPPGPSRLEDLFQPVDETVEKSLSYELVEKQPSDHSQPVTNSTEDMDVFHHLFDDDEAK